MQRKLAPPRSILELLTRPAATLADLAAITGLCYSTLYNDVQAGELIVLRRASAQRARASLRVSRTACAVYLTQMGYGKEVYAALQSIHPPLGVVLACSHASAGMTSSISSSTSSS